MASRIDKRTFHTCSANALIVLVGLCGAGSTQAQALVTNQISINVTGKGTGNALGGLNLTGTGTVEPFGNVTVVVTSTPGARVGSPIALMLTFTFSGGGTLTATSSGQGALDQILGTASVSGGTGQFQAASGSFGYKIAVSAGTTAANVQYTLTGNGSVTSAAAASDALIVSQNQINYFGTQAQSFPVLAFASAASAASIAVSATIGIPAAPWLTVLRPAQTAANPSTTSMTLVLDPAGLSAGVYTGTVVITATPSGGMSTKALSQSIQVTLIVPTPGTQPVPYLLLSQTGLRFTSAGSAPPAQQIQVSSSSVTSGSSSLPFTVMASTQLGGSWLSVTPGAGTASATAPVTVNVQVNPAGLGKGTYFGTVDFSQGAVTAQQSVVVVLNVQDVTTGDPGFINPFGLLFAAEAAHSPPAQAIQVNNVGSSPITMAVSTVYQQGTGWLTVKPTTFSVAAGQQQAISVTVNAAGLGLGIYNAIVSLQVTSGSQTEWGYPVAIVMVVLPPGQPAAQFRAAAQAACSPTQLIPVFTSLGTNFQRTSAFPVTVSAAVMDNCGSPLVSGTVVASFSTGDPAVTLAPLGNGQWVGTWRPHNETGGPVSVNLFAANSTLTGFLKISGTLAANATTPVVSTGGVVSAASVAPNQPAAPGSFISIFGQNLAAGVNAAVDLPLPTALAGTQVLLGGVPLSLQFENAGQINAIVPYDMPVNTTLPLIVAKNGELSTPEPVSIAEAQPAVFMQGGAGIIVVVKTDGTQFQATPSKPAAAGDTLVIYSAGLGAVTPPVPAGAAAPSSMLTATVNPVTVRIGGKAAQVLFAGLVPGFAGLYQVNVTVPTGVSTGPVVPVVLSVAGSTSLPVTIPIQ